MLEWSYRQRAAAIVHHVQRRDCLGGASTTAYGWACGGPLRRGVSSRSCSRPPPQLGPAPAPSPGSQMVPQNVRGDMAPRGAAPGPRPVTFWWQRKDSTSAGIIATPSPAATRLCTTRLSSVVKAMSGAKPCSAHSCRKLARQRRQPAIHRSSASSASLHGAAPGQRMPGRQQDRQLVLQQPDLRRARRASPRAARDR